MMPHGTAVQCNAAWHRILRCERAFRVTAGDAREVDVVRRRGASSCVVVVVVVVDQCVLSTSADRRRLHDESAAKDAGVSHELCRQNQVDHVV